MCLRLERIKKNCTIICDSSNPHGIWSSPLCSCIFFSIGSALVIGVLVAIYFAFVGIGIATEIALYHNSADIHTGCGINQTTFNQTVFNQVLCPDELFCNMRNDFNMYFCCPLIGGLTLIVLTVGLFIVCVVLIVCTYLVNSTYDIYINADKQSDSSVSNPECINNPNHTDDLNDPNYDTVNIELDD